MKLGDDDSKIILIVWFYPGPHKTLIQSCGERKVDYCRNYSYKRTYTRTCFPSKRVWDQHSGCAEWEQIFVFEKTSERNTKYPLEMGGVSLTV